MHNTCIGGTECNAISNRLIAALSTSVKVEWLVFPQSSKSLPSMLGSSYSGRNSALAGSCVGRKLFVHNMPLLTSVATWKKNI